MWKAFVCLKKKRYVSKKSVILLINNSNVYSYFWHIHTDGLIRHDDLPLHFKIDSCCLPLELLTTIEIVKILEHSTQNFLEIYYNIPLPKVLCENIKKEFEYQMDMYFTNIIKPDIDYNYLNKY